MQKDDQSMAIARRLKHGCPFCDLQNNFPPHVIFSNERLFVMLDREGLAFGHVMVIPRDHDIKIYDMDDSDYSTLMNTSKKLATIMQESLAPKAVSYVAHGAGLPHVHLHLVPLSDQDEITNPRNFMRHLTDEQLAEEAKKLLSILPRNLGDLLSAVK